jgi:hypothetical protein
VTTQRSGALPTSGGVDEEIKELRRRFEQSVGSVIHPRFIRARRAWSRTRQTGMPEMPAWRTATAPAASVT